MSQTNVANFIGVGVGPGDPELVTLKAARYIAEADVISYIANIDGHSQAKSIVQGLLDQRLKAAVDNHGGYQEIPLLMPMSEDRSLANQVYDDAAIKIRAALADGKKVVFLCEGDPLFFGSFAYLLQRLEHDVECQIVPGITSVNAAASAIAKPLTVLTESFAVISGRHDQARLVSTLKSHDSVVIMKAGRSRAKILAAIAEAERTHEASYLEYISRENQKVVLDIQQLDEHAGPYFSLFVVLKSERNSR